MADFRRNRILAEIGQSEYSDTLLVLSTLIEIASAFHSIARYDIWAGMSSPGRQSETGLFLRRYPSGPRSTAPAVSGESPLSRVNRRVLRETKRL